LDNEVEPQRREDEDEELYGENNPMDMHIGDVLRTTIKNEL
jgi:hypothetical protein